MSKLIDAEWVALLTGSLCGIAAVAAALARSHYERTHFTVTDYTIKSKKISPDSPANGGKMVILADLHGNEFGSGNEELVEAIKKQSPDWIIIAGDAIVTKEYRPMNFDALDRLLTRFDSLKIPVYYTKGNHEERMKLQKDLYPGWQEAFMNVIERHQVTLLGNETVELLRSGKPTGMQLIAYDLPLKAYGKCVGRNVLKTEDITSRVGKADPACYNILCAHSPLFAECYSAWGADVSLCGHFHGGTIRLPYLGGLMSPQFQFFSGFDRGCYEVNEGHYLITSGGLGTHSINLRLGNISELVVATFACEDEE